MGERKGQNKYYPPDFDPRKHKSLDNYHGTHPLRERARKLGQGILIIRFEMPYNIWCGGCNAHIGMGVRYNAEKRKVGNYYTTPIYQFRMKCHLCDNYFEIKTDPQNHDYVIVEGARRKEQRWDPKENEQIITEDKNDIKKRALDAMYRLEHTVDDKAKSKTAAPTVHQLETRQAQWKDDYMLNKLARNKFRGEKKAIKAENDKTKALLSKSSLAIDLVDEHQDDIHLAGLMKLKSVDTYEEKQTKKRQEISNRPIFKDTSVELSKRKTSGILNILESKKLQKQAFQNTSKQSKTDFGIVRRNDLHNTKLSAMKSIEQTAETQNSDTSKMSSEENDTVGNDNKGEGVTHSTDSKQVPEIVSKPGSCKEETSNYQVPQESTSASWTSLFETYASSDSD